MNKPGRALAALLFAFSTASCGAVKGQDSDAGAEPPAADAAIDAADAGPGTLSVQGHFSTVGPPMGLSGSLNLVDQGLERQGPTCSNNLCISGGITP